MPLMALALIKGVCRDGVTFRPPCAGEAGQHENRQLIGKLVFTLPSQGQQSNSQEPEHQTREKIDETPDSLSSGTGAASSLGLTGCWLTSTLAEARKACLCRTKVPRMTSSS